MNEIQSIKITVRGVLVTVTDEMMEGHLELLKMNEIQSIKITVRGVLVTVTDEMMDRGGEEAHRQPDGSGVPLHPSATPGPTRKPRTA